MKLYEIRQFYYKEPKNFQKGSIGFATNKFPFFS